MAVRSSVERMLYVTLLLVFVLACILTFSAVQATNRAKEQQTVLQQQVDYQEEVLEGVRTLVDNQGKTTAEINHSLSCILTFFTRPNRADYYISDLSTCTLTNTGTGDTEVLQLPVAQAPQNTAQTPSDDTAVRPAPTPTPAPPITPSTPPEPASEPTPALQTVTKPILEFLQNAVNIVQGVL